MIAFLVILTIWNPLCNGCLTKDLGKTDKEPPKKLYQNSPFVISNIDIYKSSLDITILCLSDSMQVILSTFFKAWDICCVFICYKLDKLVL